MAVQNDTHPIPETKPLDEFQLQFLKLPNPVQEWMCSLTAAENNAQIAKKFNLTGDKNPILAKLTGDIILKSAALDALPSLLQENLRSDQQTAKQIALEIAVKQFLIIRDYLKDTENFILKLGGTIPAKIPSLSSAVATSAPSAAGAIPAGSIKKSFRLAVQENKEVLNQPLTANPIKIAEFDQPVRPTIKNWLADYIKQKGTGHHDELERSDYLFKSSNATNLPQEERVKLSKMLKAYDEDIEVPISPDTKLIDMEELMKRDAPKPTIAAAAPSAPKPAFAPSNQPSPQAQTVPATPLQSIQTPPRPAATPVSPPPQPRPYGGPDTYREKVADEDLAGPLKPPPRPAPKLDGNIIDLKNMGE